MKELTFQVKKIPVILQNRQKMHKMEKKTSSVMKICGKKNLKQSFITLEKMNGGK
jgi:hypothetical protein